VTKRRLSIACIETARERKPSHAKDASNRDQGQRELVFIRMFRWDWRADQLAAIWAIAFVLTGARELTRPRKRFDISRQQSLSENQNLCYERRPVFSKRSCEGIVMNQALQTSSALSARDALAPPRQTRKFPSFYDASPLISHDSTKNKFAKNLEARRVVH